MRELAGCLRAVFFDLDETLLDDDRNMRRAVARTCCTLGQLHPDVDPARLEGAYLRVAEETWMGPGGVQLVSGSSAPKGAEIRVRVWREALGRCGLSGQDVVAEAARIYGQERRNGYRLFPEAQEVLKALGQRFKLGVITNGTGDVQREKARVTGTEAYVDVFLVSGEVGVAKPAREIFLRGLEALGVAARQALYVGDSLVFDIAGAKAAGMYAAWINRARLPRQQDMPNPDVELFSLRDLLPILTAAG